MATAALKLSQKDVTCVVQYFVAYTAPGEFFLTDKKCDFSQQDDGVFTPWKNEN
jgi:hypothetical protein